MNILTTTGRLGKDWESRQAGNSTVYSNTLATDDGKDKETGERKTLWIGVSAWGTKGQTLAQYSGKGDMIGLSGKITLQTYVNKNGEEVTSLKLDVQDFSFVGKARATGEAAEPVAAPKPIAKASQELDDEIPF